MKKVLIFGSFIISLAFSGNLWAQGSYFSIGGGLLTFDDGFESIEPIQLVGRVGHDFNEYIGLGGEFGFSLIDDEFAGVDFDVTTFFLYLRGMIPVNDDSFIYAVVGPTNVELTASVNSASASADEDGTGFGFGFQTKLDSYSFFVESISYYDDDGVEVDSINLGISSYF